VVTVAVSYVDRGNANLFVAMLVASIKASVVARFLIHQRWDKPVNGLILLGIFIGLALLDTKEYQPEIVPMYELEGQMKQQLDTPPG
jgi:cytochrome c oxidase subunit 4